jgi:hypothetical protein
MAQTSKIPQQLITAALLHFENGVPIDDCNVQGRGHRDRLARVHHVYFQWLKNPMLDTFEMFRMLLQGQCSDRHSLFRMAQRDNILFDFVKEHIALSSRKQDEAIVRAAAKQAIKIGLETDNVNALTKGGKLLYDVAGLDKPESEQAELSKTVFLPPIVTTIASDVDPTKKDVNDEQANAILRKYGAAIDEKRIMVEERVAAMEARREARSDSNTSEMVVISEGD